MTALFVPGILVVDDEPHVLGLLDRILQLGGFAVWLAASGPEAFDIYRQHTAQIAAVLLDVRMTGWDGPETLKALQSINPAVRFCFMTGQAGDYTEEDLLALGSPCVLFKPFGMDQVIHLAGQLTRGIVPPFA